MPVADASVAAAPVDRAVSGASAAVVAVAVEEEEEVDEGAGAGAGAGQWMGASALAVPGVGMGVVKADEGADEPAPAPADSGCCWGCEPVLAMLDLRDLAVARAAAPTGVSAKGVGLKSGRRRPRRLAVLLARELLRLCDPPACDAEAVEGGPASAAGDGDWSQLVVWASDVAEAGVGGWLRADRGGNEAAAPEEVGGAVCAV